MDDDLEDASITSTKVIEKNEEMLETVPEEQKVDCLDSQSIFAEDESFLNRLKREDFAEVTDQA